MMKSVPCQNCPVKRSLSMKGKENDIQTDLKIGQKIEVDILSSGIKYLYLEYQWYSAAHTYCKNSVV
jgi:hypothetical protein